MIKLILDSLRKSTNPDLNILIFKEENGERYLPIWIGLCEAQMLLEKLENRTPEQVATYDYFTQFLRQSDLKVEKIFIHALVDKVYYAQVIAVRRKFLSKEVVEFDCRPSDATLLALYCKAPIYASVELMNQASILRDENPSPNASETNSIDRTLPETLDPYEDFWQNFFRLDD